MELERTATKQRDQKASCLLGPQYTEGEMLDALEAADLAFDIQSAWIRLLLRILGIELN